MAVLHEILKWTTSLPSWQQDAARRLFENEVEISKEDFDELYEIFKRENKLGGDESVKAIPLDTKNLPVEINPGDKIVLVSLHDLQDVNRLAPGQSLKFAKDGLTIVFGPNSSGKSGYARVLKAACRARDQSERVHPNATDRNASHAIPCAVVDVEVNGIAKSVRWSKDADSPEELSAISVFDSRCARSYVTAEQDVAYLPYGLDILKRLADEVIPELRKRIDEEIYRVDTSSGAFDHLIGDTEVGRLIRDLSPKTKPEAVKTLATLRESEVSRLAEIKRALAQADPAERGRELRRSALRLKRLADAVEQPLGFLGATAEAELRRIKQKEREASKNEKLAADALGAGENLLPGTGETVWKSLYEAARRFSVEIAYPDKQFPHVSESAVCVFCQQEITVETAQRLERFEQFVQEDVSRKASIARAELERERRRLENTVIENPVDDALIEELSQLDVSLPSAISGYLSEFEDRRVSFLQALAKNDWSDVVALPVSPRRKIRNLAAKQLRASRRLMRAADTDLRVRLNKELSELEARDNLSKVLDAVLVLVQRMKRRARLEEGKTKLQTRRISDKVRQLSDSAVTEELKKALEAEFRQLKIGHIRTTLKHRTERGNVLHQIMLDVPTSAKIDEILSEGEQRAIAIAAFLAELSLADHSCGIVFDDPVSSLDYWRRKQVAARLVAEANRRQVIIFTHDTTFLGQLCDEIESSGVSHANMHLEWHEEFAGFVRDGLPWDHQGYRERIDSLEKGQKRIERTWPQYPGDEHISAIRQEYDRFRATLERVVEDVVLNGVIERFRNWIKVKKLGEVVGFELSEFEAIETLHARASDIVTGHDRASSQGDPPPTPDELKNDIQELKDLIDRIKHRRRHQRKAVPASPN